MASNLACIGLAVSDTAELAHLLNTVWPSVREIGAYDGVHVGRWQDDSGAALILGWRPDRFLEALPTYAATRGGLLSDCELINEPFTIASVRTVGFEADLCLAGSEHPGIPAPGNIVSGTVFLSAAIDGPALQTRNRRLTHGGLHRWLLRS